MPLCSYREDWSHVAKNQLSYKGFQCDMQQTEIISVVIDSTNIKLIKMFAEPYITVSSLIQEFIKLFTQ